MSCSQNNRYKLVRAIEIAKAMDRKVSVDEIQQLLKEGENPDDSPRGLPPPLHYAVQFDCPDIAMLLLKAGCKLRASPLVEQSHPPIISNATAHNMTQVVLYMCSRPDCDLFTVDTQLRTIVHIAAEKGNLDLIKGLRSLTGSDFEKFLFLRDGIGRTPLHIAALFGWVKVLKLLLYGDEHFEPENTENPQSEDLRSVPSGPGDLEANRDARSADVPSGPGLNGDWESLSVRTTTGDGKDTGWRQEEKRERWVDHRVLGSKETMLHLAAQNHHLMVMQFLLRCGATVNARDLLRCTPLVMVMARDPDYKSAPDCAECLLKAGADWSLKGTVQTTMNSLPIYHRRHFSRLNQQVTAAMAAALRNQVDYLKLLSEFGDTFEGVSGCGMTPLMSALSTGSEEAARFLLSHYPEDSRFHTWAGVDAGTTPLHLVSACRSKAGELTQMLLDRGYGAVLRSPVTTGLPSATYKALMLPRRGITPITQAIVSGRMDVLKALVAYHPCCLMENYPTCLHSPLHMALTVPYPYSIPFVDFLLAHGADGNVIVEGLTPYQYVISTARSLQKKDEEQHPSAAYLKKKLGAVFMEWGEGAAGKWGSGSERWSLKDRCLECVRGILRARTRSSYLEGVWSLPLPPSLSRALLFES